MGRRERLLGRGREDGGGGRVDAHLVADAGGAAAGEEGGGRGVHALVEPVPEVCAGGVADGLLGERAGGAPVVHDVCGYEVAFWDVVKRF